MHIFTARWEGKQGGNMAEEMLINSEECIMADFDLLYRILYILMQIFTARWEGKQGGNMAEEMLISAEESVMANFDFLSREGGGQIQGFLSDTIYFRFESGPGSLFGLRHVVKLKIPYRIEYRIRIRNTGTFTSFFKENFFCF
jgi:hypothetical protein